MRHKQLKNSIVLAFLLFILCMITSESTVLGIETVTVGNQAPVFSHPPARHEITERSGSLGQYTYKAWGYDQNGDSYYMRICGSSNGANDAHTADCTAQTICSSNITASGTTAYCSPETEQEIETEAHSENWFVVLCDTNLLNQSCSQPWNGSLPIEKQESIDIFDPPATTVQPASTSRSNPPSIEEITYNSLLLLLLCGAAIAVPLLILSFRDKKQAERLTVSLSLFIMVFTSFFGLAATWPEKTVPQDTLVLGEKTTNPQVQTSPHTLPSIQNGIYPIYLEPDTNSPVLYEAHEQERFTVRKKQEQWIQVFLPNSGSGWIPASSIK